MKACVIVWENILKLVGAEYLMVYHLLLGRLFLLVMLSGGYYAGLCKDTIDAWLLEQRARPHTHVSIRRLTRDLKLGHLLSRLSYFNICLKTLEIEAQGAFELLV